MFIQTQIESLPAHNNRFRTWQKILIWSPFADLDDQLRNHQDWLASLVSSNTKSVWFMIYVLLVYMFSGFLYLTSWGLEQIHKEYRGIQKNILWAKNLVWYSQAYLRIYIHIYIYIYIYIYTYIYKEFCIGGSKAKTVLYISYSTARYELCYIIRL